MKRGSLLLAAALLLAGPHANAAQAGNCTAIPDSKIGFQLATVMGGFMPPGSTPLPNPDPARMRAGTANPPMPQRAPDPEVFRSYLKQLRAIGFRNVERFGGTLQLDDSRYVAIMKDSGIQAVSSHGALEEPEWTKELDRAQALGQEYVGSWGFGPIGLDSFDHVLATAANLDRLGKMASTRGLRFMVHDHDAALRFRYPYDLDGDGQKEMATAWEIIAARTNPQTVRFEVDVHWALKALGSEDALVAFLRRNRTRIDLLHVKDRTATGAVTDLGRGINDWPRIFAAAGDGIRYYIWEYERPADPLKSAKIAYRYLRCVAEDGSFPQPSAYSPDRLAARAEIEDRIHDWARGLDRRDWALAKSIFFPDAIVHHGTTGSPAALVARLSAGHRDVALSTHHISNILIEFAGPDFALAESYVMVIQRKEVGKTGSRYVMTSGRYIDRFERRVGIWKIAARTTIFDAAFTAAAPVYSGPPDAGWVTGRRDRDDPLMIARKELGFAAATDP